MKTKRTTKTAGKESVVGTYVYDRELGRLVKVSDRIPGVAGKRKFGGGDEVPCGEGPCEAGPCGGGMCGMDE